MIKRDYGDYIQDILDSILDSILDIENFKKEKKVGNYDETCYQN